MLLAGTASFAAPPDPAAPTQPGSAQGDGPPLAAPSGLSLQLSGLLQSDWVVHRQSSRDEIDPASGAPQNQDRFLLRRARLRLDVRRAAALGRLALDLNSLRTLTVRPFEAYAGVQAALSEKLDVRARLGLMRIPFGFDAVESALERPVLERTHMVRALFPGQRDLGASIEVRFDGVQLELAVMNGAPAGELSGAELELNAAKDVVGRIGVEAEPVPAIRVSAGLSGLSGRGLHRGNAATKDRLAWNDGNEDGFVALSELSVIPGSPATASRTFQRFALGADVRLRLQLSPLGGLELRGEVIRAVNLDRALEPADPVASGRDLRELGWALGAALELTRWAQLAVRYDQYRPDADARRSLGAELVPLDPRYGTLAAALSGRLEPLRVMLEYDHNDNPLGRTTSGSPTRLRDDALTLRGELRF